MNIYKLSNHTKTYVLSACFNTFPENFNIIQWMHSTWHKHFRARRKSYIYLERPTTVGISREMIKADRILTAPAQEFCVSISIIFIKDSLRVWICQRSECNGCFNFIWQKRKINEGLNQLVPSSISKLKDRILLLGLSQQTRCGHGTKAQWVLCKKTNTINRLREHLAKLGGKCVCCSWMDLAQKSNS